MLLHFGVPEARDCACGEFGVRALHRIALSPTAAQQPLQLRGRVLAGIGCARTRTLAMSIIRASSDRATRTTNALAPGCGLLLR